MHDLARLSKVLEAWNEKNLEGVLSHYSEECVLVSPAVRTHLGIADGTLRGTQSVRAWWQRAMSSLPDRPFEISRIAEGVDSVIMMYGSKWHGAVVASEFTFDTARLISKERFYE